MHYIAVYETDEGDVCQGIVAFPSASRHRFWYSDRWFQRVFTLVQIKQAIPGIRFASRISLRGGRVDQLLIFTAASQHEAALRRYLAGFLELLAWVDDSVSLPVSREQHNTWTECWPSHLCSINTAGYREARSWVACNFRMHPMLPSLLEEADALGFDFFYQASIQPLDYTPELERRVRHNAVQVESLSAAPLPLLQLQTELLSRSAGRVGIIQEFTGTSSDAGARWLAQRLATGFHSAFGATRLPTPAFDFEVSRLQSFIPAQSNLRELVALGLHEASIRTLSDDETVNAIMAPTEEAMLMDWSGTLRRWFQPGSQDMKEALRQSASADENKETAAARAAAHLLDVWNPPIQITNAREHYSFISYRRSDLERIAPLLSTMNSAGHPFWIDRAIPGSTAWMEVLQQRIQSCNLLLLFLSRQAADSKWVRHEATYAYSLDKPVLPVLLDSDLDLRHLPGGFGLLLNPIHCIPNNDAELLRHLSRFRV